MEHRLSIEQCWKIALWHLSLVENCLDPELLFIKCVPMSEFCGNMLVACQYECTARWLICAIEVPCAPRSAVPFKQFFVLVPCSLVLSVVKPVESRCSQLIDFLWTAVINCELFAQGNYNHGQDRPQPLKVDTFPERINPERLRATLTMCLLYLPSRYLVGITLQLSYFEKGTRVLPGLIHRNIYGALD